MQNHVRAAIAVVCLSHFLRRKISGIHSTDSGFLNLEAFCDRGRVEGFDFGTGSHFDGTIPELFHYGLGSHIEFNPRGNGFYEGFEYGSSSFFEVKLQGTEAELYDFGTGSFHFFSA